jgi:peroxiredoxin
MAMHFFRNLPLTMMTMRNTLLTLGALAFCIGAQAQPGYKLDFKIKGWKDTTAYLGYFQGDQTFVKDTARVNATGEFSFEGSKSLLQGVYMLILNKSRVLDFVIGADQRFAFEGENNDLIRTAKVTGDDDNRLFFEYGQFDLRQREKAEPIVKILRDSTLKEESKKEARADFKKVSDEVTTYQTELIKSHPTTMTARFFKAQREVEIPPAPKRADGTVDSTFQFRYYKEHYFDNLDLSDDALVRLPRPIFQEKIKDYLDRLVFQHPDTLTKEVVKLATKAKPNPEAYKWVVWTCFSHYSSHKIMGLDEVYVNIFDKYIASGEMDYWLDKKSKQNFKEYVDKIRISLVGHTAPDLVMQDQNFKPRSMYDIKKRFTILYIFDPKCGHCREETPKLVDFYNKYKTRFDVEVYAVSLDTSMQKMRDYIKEMHMTWVTVNGPRTYVGTISKLYYSETTPTMYIIDDKHKIAAKKLGIEQLPEFFERNEKMAKKQPNSNKGT